MVTKRTAAQEAETIEAAEAAGLFAKETSVLWPAPATPISATEVTEQLRAAARKEGRMAVIRSIYHVHVRGKGPTLGNAPNFSGGRLDAFDYAKEMAQKTGLAIIETGANIDPLTLAGPGVYVRSEVYDENRPGEYRCVRTYGQHY